MWNFSCRPSAESVYDNAYKVTCDLEPDHAAADAAIVAGAIAHCVPKDVLKDFSGRTGEHVAKMTAICKGAAGDAAGLTVETLAPAMENIVEAYSALSYPEHKIHAVELKPDLAFSASDFDSNASADAGEFAVVARVIAVRCFTGLSGKQVNDYFLGMEYAHARATIASAVPADVLMELQGMSGSYKEEADEAFEANKAAVGEVTGLSGATLVAAMTAVGERTRRRAQRGRLDRGRRRDSCRRREAHGRRRQQGHRSPRVPRARACRHHACVHRPTRPLRAEVFRRVELERELQMLRSIERRRRKVDALLFDFARTSGACDAFSHRAREREIHVRARRPSSLLASNSGGSSPACQRRRARHVRHGAPDNAIGGTVSLQKCAAVDYPPRCGVTSRVPQGSKRFFCEGSWRGAVPVSQETYSFLLTDLRCSGVPMASM